MTAVERYTRLFHDLREDVSRFFDQRSPLSLSTFLRGYEQGDPVFCDVAANAHEAVMAKYPAASGMDAGTALYLCVDDLAHGHNLYVSIFVEVLAHSGVRVEPEEYQPLQRTLRAFLADLRSRAPMLIGSWDVRDAYTFLQGFLRGLEDCSHDTTCDRNDLRRMESYLQSLAGVQGRWDRLLFAEDAGQGRSVVRFVEVFEQVIRARAPLQHQR